jgi:hypothetical protein
MQNYEDTTTEVDVLNFNFLNNEVIEKQDKKSMRNDDR